MRLGRNERIRIQLTKNDMARVIVQALYGLRELPNDDDERVRRMIRRVNREEMVRQHKQALIVIEQWIEQGICA